MGISEQINARIQQFVKELDELVREAALEAVRTSLGGAAAPRAARARPVAGGAAPARKRGGKRDPKVIEALVARVAAHVKSSPGQGVEAMAKSLGVTTHDITLPINKLLASKTIKKKGQKRATKYYPG